MPAAGDPVPAEGAAPDGQALLDFLATMRRLRRECGWKAAQTHRSLGRYLLEEAHEVLEAVDVLDEQGDPAPLRELTLLTTKPFLYVFNVDADELANESLIAELRALVAGRHAQAGAVQQAPASRRTGRRRTARPDLPNAA